MLVPNPDKPKSEYRYGFQGQEKDDEIKGGEGNSLNYAFRMHDPRIGRFFAVNPLEAKYPFYSPYQFSGNRLIDMVELEGLEPRQAATAEGQRENAIDQAVLDSRDYGPLDFFKSLFDNTENNKLYKTWVGHSVSGTDAPVWYEEANYKQMIMPIAIDYAKSEGWSLGSDWKSAKELIASPGAPNNMISEETQNFLSSRTTSGDFRDYLTEIGANAINSANKALADTASGRVSPQELSSPFFIIAGFIPNRFATGTVISSVRVSNLGKLDTELMTTDALLAEKSFLEKALAQDIEQLQNGRNQIAREMNSGHTSNPHGIGDEVNRTIPNSIRYKQNRINEINDLLNN
ncbi:hypothetical protein AR687_24230 [Flavobacteriaceae bacterium CRH]|nr:hypothetical protein AR687_24230 [Flavobacteriaceae bacterium CRH]